MGAARVRASLSHGEHVMTPNRYFGLAVAVALVVVGKALVAFVTFLTR
jgi:hypothetical protein